MLTRVHSCPLSTPLLPSAHAAASERYPFSAMGKTLQHVTPVERQLIQYMVKDGLPWTQITRITGRSSE